MLFQSSLIQNKIHFTSLGCARNLVDSEVMIGILLKAGYECVEKLQDADFLVVNTCGFLEASRQEGFETIAELFREKKEGAKVVVAGCMVNKCKEELQQRFPQTHYFLGSGDAEQILNAVHAEEKGEVCSSVRSYLEWGEVPRTLSTPQHYAYLKIAEGCRKRCAFCIIPTIKGPLRSKSDDQVLKEFRVLRNRGVFEQILIAQDLGDYGKDRKEKGALANLLKTLLQEPGEFWIRLLYLYPDEIDDELIAVMKSDRRICPYLDMPIQHISDPILKAMHRTTSRAEIVSTIEKLRKELPHVAIRTSLMVGFPGETEEQFKELVQFVKQTGLDQVGIFQFSLEKEAYAARLPDQISADEKQRRFEILAKAQQKVVKNKLRKWVGQRVEAIVDGVHPDSPLLFCAHHAGQCPELDGQIIINDVRKGITVGKLHQVEITDVAGYDLIGRVIGQIGGMSCKKLALF
jgi:ribosomal protein S12 methylthiotransferase